MMIQLVSIALGGFCGAIIRYMATSFIQNKFNSQFPIGTLSVNLLGSFLLGALLSLDVSKNIYVLLGIGFLGSFTTFSTFVVEVMQQWLTRNKLIAAIYLAVTYIGGLLCAVLGYML
ncbi:fluoride exporter [Cytobacillus horneckiae]|nr:fluoride efflux transporter CrcB [Cytobacillus horneckiae]MCM3177636.1 fluoride efflux transporter CrcB [Cytobacillus horneckiae]MEC1157941.1 fluoride efflux transporter CrcB [Cytobacillus horneckiae]MED2937134.1 fluoride efflux transporter CrcB [Cytobacillus horneckiae]